MTELVVNGLVFPQERKLPGSFDDGEQPYSHQTVKDMNYFFYFEAHNKIIYETYELLQKSELLSFKHSQDAF